MKDKIQGAIKAALERPKNYLTLSEFSINDVEVRIRVFNGELMLTVTKHRGHMVVSGVWENVDETFVQEIEGFALAILKAD